jgi:hypothetical protein
MFKGRRRVGRHTSTRERPGREERPAVIVVLVASSWNAIKGTGQGGGPAGGGRTALQVVQIVAAVAMPTVTLLHYLGLL